MTRYRLHLAVVFLLLIGTGFRCNAPSRLPGPSSEIPVILISIDTLRSDRLPAYGFRGVETPHLDQLRADSVLFTHAYAHSPLTLPSHATMLTGLSPADTGLRDNVGYFLKEDVATLPELLRKNGYATGAAVSAYTLREETGMSRGFDFYEDDMDVPFLDAGIGRIQRPGRETIQHAQDWIAARNRQPFFFMLHLYEPHTPYDPPEPYKSRYAEPYLGEIAAVDGMVGEFLTFLRDKDLYDRSLIILVSDHGEGLGDHGEDEHGIFLYREAIQVPLFLKLPDGAFRGRTVNPPVQLSDLFPTVAAQTATPIDASSVAGKSLLSFVDGTPQTPRMVYSESYYPRFHFGWSELHSLIDGQYHFIQAPVPELYDLSRDPDEKKNTADQNRRVFAAMRKAIAPHIVAADKPAEVDPEEASKLAALGYLGSTVVVDPNQELPDPKTEIAVFPKLQAAFALFQENKFEAALQAFDELLAENPHMVDVWEAKSRALARTGRFRESIEVAREGLRVNPSSGALAVAIAVAALEVQDYDLARSHAELAAKTFPAQAHDLLARIALARGDLNNAETEARRALSLKPDRAASMITLARVEIRRENHEAALELLNLAADNIRTRKKPPLASLQLLRGDVLARLGHAEEAEAAFKKEIQFFPQDPSAYRGLIFLYVAEGRIQEGTQLVHQLLKASPTPRSYVVIIDVMEKIGDERGMRYWTRRGVQQFPDHPVLRRLASRSAS